MKIFKITWLDAVGEDGSGWVDLDTVKQEKLVPVTSVGFLVSKTDEHWTLCMSYEPTNEKVAAYITIPNVLATEIVEL